jgi:hypothetical protein
MKGDQGNIKYKHNLQYKGSMPEPEKKVKSKKSKHCNYRQQGRVETDALNDIPLKKFYYASL